METMSTPAIEVRNLTVTYDRTPVLSQIDLAIRSGVVMGLVGPNGAGKSTLLKAILNLVPKRTGEISIMGKPQERNRGLVSYVPQRSAIDWDFPTDVLDVVMMGTYGRLGWFRRPGKRERQESMEALARLEMDHLADRQIGQLSGGQQQRVFLARAFVQNAPILFFDEPFTGVDAVTEKIIIDCVHEMRDNGKTIVVVQHDLNTIGTYLDEVTLINQRIVASGNTEKTFCQAAIDETYCTQVCRGRIQLEPVSLTAETTQS